MIDGLVRFSLRHRAIVLAGAIALSVFGLFRARSMPIDVFPDVSSARVTILTEAPGLAPIEVEQLVTFPIETAVNGTSGVRRMRSASSAGLSIVWLDFDWNTESVVARQRVTERLRAAQLPPEAHAPYLAPASSVMAEIAFIALVPEEDADIDELGLRRAAELDVRRHLLGTPGIAEVTVIGGYEREYQVLLDEERLQAYGVGVEEVADALERGSANAAGGYLVERGMESVVRVLGRAHDVEQIGAITVAQRQTVAVRVRDIGTVRIGPAVRRGAGGFSAEDAVVLGVLKQPDADTIATTEAMDEALDQLEPSLGRRGIRIERESFRQSTFIERATDNLFEALRDGALLVALVLIFFLWSPGATVVSVLALPLSLLSATLLLELFDLSLNTMTLGGLAIAVGELVDDAIVDVENVTRRLRERELVPESERPARLATVLRASLEIRSAIVSATLVIALVFVPLLFLGGFEGRLLRPLALAYLVAIGASLIVALTVTPALASLLLRRPKRSEPPVQHRLLSMYEPLLQWALARPVLCAGVTLAAVVAGILALLGAGRSFLPEMNEGSATITMVGLPGTALEDADELGRLSEEALLEDPAVVATTRRTGRATHDEHVLGPETTELEVLLNVEDPRSPEEVVEALRERLEVIPGGATFGQPISHRIDHMLHGQKAAISVRVIGEDLAELQRVAARVGAVIGEVPGAVDAQVEPIVNVPNLVVEVDDAVAARYGMSRGEAARAIGVALWGREVGRIFEDGTATPIVVRYPDRLREDRARLGAARVPTPAGALVPVEALADLRDDRSPNYVMRENAQRRVTVTANVASRDLVAVAQAVRVAVDEGVDVPDGVRLQHGGRYEQEQQASSRLLLLGLLAILGVALVVGVTLRSIRRAVIVLANLPLALAGGVAGVYLAGTMSLATTIGFITLFGIATRNGLLLATRAGDLEREGVERREAVVRGARERLAPILMTAITAALGLLPLGMALGEPGAEIQAPMALVILTGLVTSTLLNMLVVPALLVRWGGGLTPEPEGF